jgi:hypothetical protein
MKVEDIAEAVAKLSPDELERFRRWFSAFEAGRIDHAEELDSTATKLGRFAGRALAELKRRTQDRKP